MNRWALLLVVLAAPLSAADVQYSGALETRDAHVPQMHCEFVQTDTRTRGDPARCAVSGRLQEATLLRIRMTGAANAYAFLYDETKQSQVTQLECDSVTVQHCTKVFSNLGLTGPRLTLRAFLEGPGGATAVVTVEKATYSLP